MKAIIFTEFSHAIGLGHLRRCEALQDILESKNITTTLMVNSAIHKDMLKGYDIIALDSYHYPQEIYNLASQHTSQALFFDDTLRLDYPDGIIINGAMGALKLPYQQKENRLLWIGIEYALVHRVFRMHKIQKIITDNVQNILLNFGGSSIGMLWAQHISKLLSKHFPALKQYIIEPSKKLNAQSIKELMMQSCIALSASGGGLNELAICGVPTIAFCIAPNQRYNFEAWRESKALRSIDSAYNHANFEQQFITSLQSLMPKEIRLQLSLAMQNIISQNYWDTLHF